MLEMLFATGMRISELMSLDLSDINAEGKLYILGKGKKERTVFMTPRSLLWLNNYLKIRLRFANTGEEKKKETESFTSECETSGSEEENEKPSDLTLEMFDDSLKYIRIVEKYRESGYLEKFESPALFYTFLWW